MGIFDSKKTTKNLIPEWLESGSQLAVQKGRDISEQPYTPYTDQRVAGMSQAERQASQLAQFGADEGRKYLDQAGQQISALQSFDQANIGQYMSPYIEATLQPQLREANRAYEQQRTRLLNTKAGAWGGDRVAFEESELARRHGELITDITNRAHAEAFDRAVQMWSQDEDRKLRAAQALQSVGGDISRLNREQIQDLMLTGGLDRVLKQAELDFDYQQFIENRDWDIRNLQPLLASLQVPHSTTTETKSSASPIGQILGAAVTLGAAYFGRPPIPTAG